MRYAKVTLRIILYDYLFASDHQKQNDRSPIIITMRDGRDGQLAIILSSNSVEVHVR